MLLRHLKSLDVDFVVNAHLGLRSKHAQGGFEGINIYHDTKLKLVFLL